jgi:predicted transcriptional regulator
MTITIELRPEVEARLAERARSHGVDVASYAASLVEEAVGPVEPARPRRTPEEIRAWLDRIAQFSDQMPEHIIDETFSREMIYQDHD